VKILVLGASGLIGSAIVGELIDRGHDVSGTGRALAIPRNLAGLDFNYVSCDIDSDGEIDRLFQGQDVVVDAAAPYALNLLVGESKAAKRPLDHVANRSKSMISSLMKHRAKLICISSSLTEPPTETNAFTMLQSKVVRSFYPYFKIKRMIEEEVLSGVRAGLQALVVRPTSCLGPGDVKSRDMCWIPKLMCGEIPAVLDHKINVLDTRDLAAAIGEILDSRSDTATITLSGHNTTTSRLITQLCDAGGIAAPKLAIPAAASIVPLFWIEVMWATIGSASPLPSLIPALLCEQRWVQQEATQQDLALGLRPLSESCRDTVTWYRNLGYC